MPEVVAKARRSYDSNNSVIKERVGAPRRSGRPGARHPGAVPRRPIDAPPSAPPEKQNPAPRHLPSPELLTQPVAQPAAPAWHAPRRRARRAHRPLRVSWTFGLVIVTLLAQLVAVLYLRGMALSAQHHSFELEARIAQAQANISRAQQQIAVWDSSARIKKLARERGWRLAQPSDFDDVTNPTPLVLAPESGAPDLPRAHPAPRRRAPRVEIVPADGEVGEGNGGGAR